MNNKPLINEEELIKNLEGQELINYLLGTNFSNNNDLVKKYREKISKTIKENRLRIRPNNFQNITSTELQNIIIDNINKYDIIALITSEELSNNEYILNKIITKYTNEITSILENEEYYIGKINFSFIKSTNVENIMLNAINHEKIFDLLANDTITNNLKEKIYQTKQKDIYIALENEEYDYSHYKNLDSFLKEKIIDNLTADSILEYILLPSDLGSDEEFINKVIARKSKELVEALKINKIDPTDLASINSKNQEFINILISSLTSSNILDFIFDDMLDEKTKENIIRSKAPELDIALKNILTDNDDKKQKLIKSYILGNIPSSLIPNIEVSLKKLYPNFTPNRKDILITEEELLDIMINTVTSNHNQKIIDLINNKFELTNLQSEEVLSLLPHYKGDKITLVKNFNSIEKFLLDNVNIDKFYQYALNIDYDYVSDIIKIIPYQDTFKRVKAYFDNNIYKDSTNQRILIDNFLNLIKNYNIYPELCLNLTNNSHPLTEEEKNNILYLFTHKKIIEDKFKPITIEDCSNINDKIKDIYTKYLEDYDNLSIDELKDIISKMLFNENFNNLKNKLSIYGNTEEMIKLQFNNRNFQNVVELASTMEIYTSLIEELISCDNKESLIKLSNNILNNFQTVSNSIIPNISYNEQMRNLYSMDTEANLTKIADFISYDSVIDKDLSNKYGVKTFDFSDKEYTLLAHTCGENEDIYNLIFGTSSGEQNFLSLVPISYRNQVYYGRGKGLILGYDTMPQENFICSSTINMGSNHAIEKNSSQVREQVREQRGILETSDPPFGNAEILCFREDLKPKYIILPEGRQPTNQEIDLAKNFNLKFAITQELDRGIKNPKKIPAQTDLTSKTAKNITELKAIKEELMQNISQVNKLRKVAIIADPHGLFEPTLAVLEDARRQGITEIYSLGDNIGTGPNPREVLNLMDKYNVKSITGNHELYITKGVDTFKKHLNKTHSYNEADRNSTWTKNQLTKEQIDKLKLYPKSREIAIGGKKILLCHSIRGFNNDNIIINPADYDKIFQGHTHFTHHSKTNIETLRGLGIGYSKDDYNKAYYVILTEKPEGGFEIEEKLVPFDESNIHSSINISTLDEIDKEKITNWTLPGRGR